MKTVSLKKIKGVIPALVTCFDNKEIYDPKRQRKVTSCLIGRGINGLYVTGSAGECFLMTPEERKKVVEDVIDEVNGRVPVIVHVGAIGTKLSVDFAKHAEKAGADVISAVPPFYWKFSEDQIFNYYKDLSEAVKLPVVAYNVAMAGIMNFSFLKRIASIEGVQGVKYTVNSKFEIMRIKEEIEKNITVFSGFDEMAIAGLAFGADGMIGSTFNLIPELFLDIYKAFSAGDMETARERQRIANAIIMFILDRGNLMRDLKAGMRAMGVDAGWCREPVGRLDKAGEEKLFSDYEKLAKQLGVKGVPFLDKV
jgi:N-acetylneuraminate lyase